MANGHGGHRDGAGRPTGAPDARTTKVRETYQDNIASRREVEVGHRNPDLEDEALAVDYFVQKRIELYDKALDMRDSAGLKVALEVIQGLEDRCFGKPRQQVELAGDPDNPLGFKVSPGFYRAQFADGTETPASAAAAGASSRVPPPARRKGKAKRKRRS